ncbi:MAG: hypothetical protein ABSF69_14530 [Polyangiaceae bacterium]|jgi:hypothetical protein
MDRETLSKAAHSAGLARFPCLAAVLIASACSKSGSSPDAGSAAHATPDDDAHGNLENADATPEIDCADAGDAAESVGPCPEAPATVRPGCCYDTPIPYCGAEVYVCFDTCHTWDEAAGQLFGLCGTDTTGDGGADACTVTRIAALKAALCAQESGADSEASTDATTSTDAAGGLDSNPMDALGIESSEAGD